MKKKLVILMIVLMMTTFTLSVWGASATRYLHARLMVFTSRLYQQISPEIESTEEDKVFTIGLLPIVDVNGEKPQLTEYLQGKIEEVVKEFSSLKLESPTRVKETWKELQGEDLGRKEMIFELGRRLDLSVVVLSSLTTHPDSYTINGIIVDVSAQRYGDKIELISLDKDMVKRLPLGQAERIELPSLINDTDQEPTPPPTTDSEDEQDSEEEKREDKQVEEEEKKEKQDEEDNLVGQKPANDNSNQNEEDQPADQVETEEKETEQTDNDQTDQVEQDTQSEDEIEAEEVIEPEQEETVPEEPEIAPEDLINEDNKISGKNISLVLKDNSPFLDDLLLGFDVGDLTGDGELEVSYISGNSLKVRSLVNYELLASYDGYRPMSNDFKILTLDIDGDKIDEIIGHGNLFEIVNNQLISQQPRFLARPVSILDSNQIAVYDNDSLYMVNYQGLVQGSYKLGKEYGKRLAITDLEGDGKKDLIITRESNDGALIDIFTFNEDDELEKVGTLSNQYGFALHTMDLNKNGKPEIYLRRNFFDGDKFLYSKIYVLESNNGSIKLLTESSRLDYFVIDFASYPAENPNRLLVGGMYMKSKKQSLNKIQSRLFYYNLETGNIDEANN